MQHPAWGQQSVRFLDDGTVEVHATSETVRAEPGETADRFFQRLRTEHGVTRADRVEVTYQADRPQYAVIERDAYGPDPPVRVLDPPFPSG